jgi:hypothetical protein
MIKTFKKEKLDGISDRIKETNCLAFASVANFKESLIKDLPVKAALASANKNQIDLFYLDTILVSTGWNKNDDVFLSDQAWAARNTPEDKQFNFMHDENDIIGHITGSYVVDIDGNLIANDIAETPRVFDIITESVIYKNWNDPVNKQRMEKIIAEIKDGKWYVSMECLFSGFNYAMVSPEGENLLLQRTEESAFLSKHLRAYGGAGEYQGYKIGRALSGLCFSGKGLVAKPANPRSIILRSQASFDLNESNLTNKFTIGENNMELEKQVAKLELELSAAKAEIETINKENAKKAKAEIDALISEKDAALAELNGKIEATAKEVAELQATLAKKTEELAAANEVVSAMKQEKMKAYRKGKLVSAGFSEVEADESIEIYDSLNDEAFDKVIAKFDWMKKKEDEKKKKEAEASEDKDSDEKKKKEAEAAKMEDEKKKKEAEAAKLEEEKKKTEASADLFDSSKADSVLTDVETDELSETRASIADWFEKNVLGTKNNKNTKGEA